MTRSKHQAQEVVADVILHCGIQMGSSSFLSGLELPSELLVLPLQHLPASKEVDGAMLRRGHEPGTRVVRDARLRPLFERRDQSVLREILGDPDVADDPGQTGDESRRFNPPDCVDRAMGIGSRHGYRSHHLQSAGASREAPRLQLGPNAGISCITRISLSLSATSRKRLVYLTARPDY